jgi:hypothetical protein
MNRVLYICTLLLFCLANPSFAKERWEPVVEANKGTVYLDRTRIERPTPDAAIFWFRVGEEDDEESELYCVEMLHKTRKFRFVWTEEYGIRSTDVSENPFIVVPAGTIFTDLFYRIFGQF